nr:hypothetical protein GCM10025732_02760 [Glycomyces mayteni]
MSPIRKRTGAAAALAAATLTALAFTATAAEAAPEYGTILGDDAAGAIAGEYIVVLEDDASFSAQVKSVEGGGADVVETYRGVDAFLVESTELEAREIAAQDGVAFVEQNAAFTTQATQTGATWGIDRIDQRNLPLSGTYTYNYTGAGVHAYIVDTGINASHTQFSGRVGNGYDFIQNDSTPQDGNGHGTHVAGTVGGTIHGVAKNVTLHGVRVLDNSGSGTTAGVINGINWVRTNAIKPAVANMSLGGATRRPSTTPSPARSPPASPSWSPPATSPPTRATAPRLHALGHHRRRHHLHRRPRLLLQLRDLRGRLRAGLVHHLGVVLVQLRDQHHLGHLDGLPARRGRRRPVPPGEPERVPVRGVELDHLQRHHRRRDQPRHRQPQPAALHLPLTG